MNLGSGEILVILLVALIVLGPTRLPEAARQVGNAMRTLRQVSTGFQDEVRHALEDAQEDAAAAEAGVSYTPPPKPTPPMSSSKPDEDAQGDGPEPESVPRADDGEPPGDRAAFAAAAAADADPPMSSEAEEAEAPEEVTSELPAATPHQVPEAVPMDSEPEPPVADPPAAGDGTSPEPPAAEPSVSDVEAPASSHEAQDGRPA
ncbi:MAG: Sec-independent protein translocase protein TatB [Actinomycetota bacterium]